MMLKLKLKVKRYLHLSYLLSLVFIFVSGLIYYASLMVVIAWSIPIELGESFQVEIRDQAGKVMENVMFDKSGRYVGLQELPDYLPQAFIAIEDKDFYNHKGLDFSRTLQSAGQNILAGRIQQGGSTITQQLARTLYLNNNKSWSRKLQELFYSLALEQRLSKERILEGYLNSVYLGHGLYGIDEASHYYFNTAPQKLSLAQGALIAGLCSAPALLSPAVDPGRAKEKQELVLELMYRQGMIDALAFNRALKEDLVYHLEAPIQTNPGRSYYLDAVYNELDELGLLNRNNLLRGLQVETHADTLALDRIEAILATHKLDPGTEVAVVALEPYSGQVKALIGGSDYHQTQFNRALMARRSIGSTIKPLIYYLGLEAGMEPATAFYSGPASFLVKDYGYLEVSNPGDNYAHRPINMIEALGTSDNVYAAKTTLLVGSNKVAGAVDFFSQTKTEATPALAFGSAEMTPMELATLYNTFASEGYYYQPRLVAKVSDSGGRVLYQEKKGRSAVLNPDSVSLVTQMMRAPFDANIAANGYTTPTLYRYQPRIQWAAKTGSTLGSSWVVAYNPYYTIVVYVGTDDNSQLRQTTLSRELFLTIANGLSTNLDGAWYPPTHRQSAIWVEPITLLPYANGSLYYFPRA